MRRFTWMAAAALSLTLGVLAAPATAGEHEYTWLGCAGQPVATTGELSGYSAGDYYNEAWHGTASGSIAPCRPPVGTDVFAIASYDTDGVATAQAARYGITNNYSAQVDVRPKTTAVCLIDNLKSRLECIKIAWLEPEVGPALPTYGGHLPVDSPLVAVAPTVTIGGMEISPGCPTCVDG